MKDFLTSEQIVMLRQAHRSLKDKKHADRIKALLSLNAGYDIVEVAKILLLDEVTLWRYVQKFQEKGIDGLLEYHYHGGKSRLNVLQQKALELQT